MPRDDAHAGSGVVNRAVPECPYCGEPATHEAEVTTLFGVDVLDVCAACAAELADAAVVTATTPGPGGAR